MIIQMIHCEYFVYLYHVFNLKFNKMKNKIFLVTVFVFVLVSCNQKNKETTTDHSDMMSKDSTMMHSDSTMMNDKTKMMGDKMYACPMHPEVQGKMHDKCSKCGMDLTEPVPEKTK